MISLKDYAIDSIVRASEFGEYRYEIYVLVDDELGIPEQVKQQFGNGSQIMLSVQNDRNPNLMFDFDSQVLSWGTSFNQVMYQKKLY